MVIIEVTFKGHFPVDLVTGLKDSEFAGLCAAVRSGDGPRTLFLHPTPHEYHILKLQLKELESEDALTFSENVANAL